MFRQIHISLSKVKLAAGLLFYVVRSSVSKFESYEWDGFRGMKNRIRDFFLSQEKCIVC